MHSVMTRSKKRGGWAAAVRTAQGFRSTTFLMYVNLDLFDKAGDQGSIPAAGRGDEYETGHEENCGGCLDPPKPLPRIDITAAC